MKFNLIMGRHEMPVEENIFDKDIEDVTDVKRMYDIVAEKLKNVKELEVYVTGLTVALGAVISYCIDNLIPLTLYHYDKESNSYYPQVILSGRQVMYLNYDNNIQDLII